jgi:autotransporter adhesin
MAEAYTNQRINQVSSQANASTAAALAAAGLTQAVTPGKSMVTAAFGYWQGQSALAAGLSHHMENGWTVKFSATVAFHGAAGGSAGAGYEF